MNEPLELRKVLIENELQRHYLRELLGDLYDALVCFMLAIYETTINDLECNHD